MTRSILQRSALTLAVAAGSLLALSEPGLAGSRSLRAVRLPHGTRAADPAAAVWNEAPGVQIDLSPVPPVHPSIRGIPAARTASIQAIRTPRKLFVRLSWPDRTADAKVAGPGSFLDGAAIQFPLEGSRATSVMMGGPGARVAIWKWKAPHSAENLYAEGFGTIASARLQDVRARGRYARGRWTVVISGPLAPADENGARLSRARTVPVAVALWDGAHRERGGLKAFTPDWFDLQL